jgi:hypothetical protein
VHYWKELGNRKEFFDNLARENGFDPLVAENWYSITRKMIEQKKVCKNKFLPLHKRKAEQERGRRGNRGEKEKKTKKNKKKKKKKKKKNKHTHTHKKKRRRNAFKNAFKKSAWTWEALSSNQMKTEMKILRWH